MGYTFACITHFILGIRKKVYFKVFRQSVQFLQTMRFFEIFSHCELKDEPEVPLPTANNRTIFFSGLILESQSDLQFGRSCFNG